VLQQGPKLDGVELEISQELSRTLSQPAGYWVPTTILAGKRQLSAGVPGAGGITIQQTVEPSLIPVLRRRSVVASLGATILENLQGDLRFPRQISASVPAWLAENAGLAPSDPSFDVVLLKPKRIGSETFYSQQLLRQSSLQVDELVRADLSKGIAVALDNAALLGTGINMPLGILNYPSNAAGAAAYGLTATEVTFAGAATWPAVLDFEGNVEALDQVSDGTGGYVASTKTKRKWKALQKSINYPSYLWENDTVNGYRALASNQIGTSDRVVFSSRWSDCIIGMWPAIDIVSDPYSLIEFNLVKVITNLLADCQFRFALSFCPSTDSGAQ